MTLPPSSSRLDDNAIEHLRDSLDNRFSDPSLVATPMVGSAFPEATWQGYNNPFGSPSASVSSHLAHSTSANSFSGMPLRGTGEFGSSNSASSRTPSVGFYQASQVATSDSLAALRYRKPFAKRVLPAGESPPKPWLDSIQRKKSDRKAYWIFVIAIGVGIAAAAALMYTSYASVPQDKYCLVLQDDFDGTEINKAVWHHEIESGGFGNEQFDWTTDSTNNSYVQDGNLYIVPTLTSDSMGDEAIINGYTLNLTADGRCTALNKTEAAGNCAVASNSSTRVILPPAQSARLTTNFSTTIRYGRVEVRAKLPTGDWLWPAIWMMPRDNFYGDWPRSGEIDIMESKGNLPKTRSDAVSNAVKSSLHFGPNWMFDGYSRATDVRRLWRNYFNQGYHKFGLEWTEEGIYTWEHSPVYKVLIHKFNKDFWSIGNFPPMMANGTVLENPWSTADNPKIAPFDQHFYLILNVAVGGTNGYFEDDKFKDKPWSNNAENARADFWAAKNKWLPTWPIDPKQRGMAVDSVKMWQKC